MSAGGISTSRLNGAQGRGEAISSAHPTAEAQRSRQRRVDAPWRRWYSTARWQRTRAHQLQVEPLCRMCASIGRVTPATVCDHKEPHRGDPVKFWGGPFQSLCAFHHDSTKQSEEKGGSPKVEAPRIKGVGTDGRPLDPNHPWRAKP